MGKTYNEMKKKWYEPIHVFNSIEATMNTRKRYNCYNTFGTGKWKSLKDKENQQYKKEDIKIRKLYIG